MFVLARHRQWNHPRVDLNLRNLPGLLIAFEGIDGAGKTTQSAKLFDTLARAAGAVVASKEPTGGPHGKRLRDSGVTGRLAPQEEFETFLADRREHVESLIIPSLKAGKTVILDRYYFSSVAYQGARGLDWRKILEANEAFAPRPDLVILLDIDPAVGINRVNLRDGKANHFERVSDLIEVRSIFNQLTGSDIQKLDASQPAESIAEEVLRLALKIYSERLAMGTGWQSPQAQDELVRLVRGAYGIKPDEA